MHSWIRRLGDIGSHPDDTNEHRLRTAILVFMATIFCIAGFAWGMMYLYLGNIKAHCIPMFYFVFSVLSIVFFAWAKNFGMFRFIQLVLILTVPFILQWRMGGFGASGMVMFWAIMAPLGALMLADPRQAMIWFGAYIVLTLVSSIFDSEMAQHSMTGFHQIDFIFHMINIIGVSTIIYLFLQYFVRERTRAMLELDEKHTSLQDEQCRSERLLLNILPKPIAERLKNDPGIIADGFDDVSILFADIVDFTQLFNRHSPKEIVMLLNDLFSIFDELAERHGLEKIKTIGDEYMAASGLPTPRSDHAQAAADMALDMIAALDKYRSPAGDRLSIRIGLNSGPVVAGVIGQKKFIYDLWGDAVNTASRMESHGLPGAIQVSEETYCHLKDCYRFKQRGVINAKGKGELHTYLLIGKNLPENERVVEVIPV